MIEAKVNQSIASPPKEKPEADWGNNVSMDSSKNRKEEGRSGHSRKSVHEKKGHGSGKHSKRESTSGKKKSSHDKKNHKKHQDAEDKEKPAAEESVNHNSSQSAIPDYHWEDHSDRHQNSTKKEGSARKSKRVSVLKDEEPEDGVFDVGLDEEPLALLGLPTTPQGLPRTPRQTDDSAQESFQKWDAEELLEEGELDKAEDQALQTSPKAPSRPVLSQQLSLGRLSPTAPPSVPRTPDPNSPTNRRVSLNLHSLGSPVPTGLQHSRSSFVPPFLVEASDDEEEDEQGNRSSSQLKTNNLLQMHNSVPATASGEWDLTEGFVPEAMGLDEGIPQINQKRRSSIL